MATTIGTALLAGLRQHIADMADKGRYQADGTWYTVSLSSAAVQANNAVHVTFYVDKPDENAVSAGPFQVVDADGNVLAEKNETVPFTQYADRILYRFKFSVTVDPGE